MGGCHSHSFPDDSVVVVDGGFHCDGVVVGGFHCDGVVGLLGGLLGVVPAGFEVLSTSTMLLSVSCEQCAPLGQSQIFFCYKCNEYNQ